MHAEASSPVIKEHRWSRLEDAARYAGISISTIRKWSKAGLPVKYLGNITLVDLHEVDAFIDRNARATPGKAFAVSPGRPRLVVKRKTKRAKAKRANS